MKAKHTPGPKERIDRVRIHPASPCYACGKPVKDGVQVEVRGYRELWIKPHFRWYHEGCAPKRMIAAIARATGTRERPGAP